MRYPLSVARSLVQQDRALRHSSKLLLHYDDPERFMQEVLALADLLRNAPADAHFELRVAGDYAALIPSTQSAGQG